MNKWLERLWSSLGSAEIEFGGKDSTFDQLDRRKVNLMSLMVEILLLATGGVISAIGINLFIAPHNIAPGGSSGLAILITEFVDFPLGLTMMAINLPAFYLGYRNLGGGPFLARTMTGALIYNIMVDLTAPLLPAAGVTDQMILNAVFGGVVTGVGSGLIYRAGGTAGAAGVVYRLLQKRYGFPFKVTTFLVNASIIAAAGFIFGWEAAMFALITFYLGGTASDFVLEGPSVVRTAMIITDYPEEVGEAILGELGRGVTHWTVEGMYSGKRHAALYCTVSRPEIKELKNLVAWNDPKAFVIIGQGHEALGDGFRNLEQRPPVVQTLEAGTPHKQENGAKGSNEPAHREGRTRTGTVSFVHEIANLSSRSCWC